MAHSTMNRGIMLSWIEHCDENGLPMPTDEEIAERFGFGTPMLARMLLAELSDKGLIHIIRERGERVGIGLGKATPGPIATPRPFRTVRVQSTPGPSVIAEEVVAEAAEISARRESAKRTSQRARERGPAVKTVLHSPATVHTTPPVTTALASLTKYGNPSSEPIKEYPGAHGTARKAPVAEVSASASRDAVSAPRQREGGSSGEPPSIPPTHGLAIPPRPYMHLDHDERIQINIRVPKAVYDRVAAIANEHDVSITRAGLRLLEQALTAPEGHPEPKPKPRIPAHIVTAAIRAGTPVETFILELAEQALAARRRERGF